jgi:hypothetical protein
VQKDGTCSSHGVQVPPKETFLFPCVQGEGAHHPTCGLHAPMKVQVTLCLHDQDFHLSRPCKDKQLSLQGSTSHNIMPSKPYLIKEPPKHVHQIPPFQNKQMLKDLIQLAKFKYGRVVMVPYWVDHSPSQGVFPKKTLSKSCKRV